MGYDPAKVGATLGPRIARLVADTVIATRLRMAPHTARLAVHAANEFLEQVSREHQDHTGAVWDTLVESGDAPEWAQKMFGFLQHGRGQWAALLGHAVLSAGVGQGIGGFLTNELNPLVTGIVAKNPNGILAPADLAQAAARKLMDRTAAYAEAARGGYDAERFTTLAHLAQHAPDPATVLDMLNRKVIDAAKAKSALTDSGLTDDWLADYLRLAKRDLSPESLADMVVRGILSEESAATQAAFSGVNSDDFHNMVLDTGETLGIESLLAAFRRGLISQGRLQHGIAQSRVRTEWTDVIEGLRYSPMSTADALRAVVQNQMPDGEGQTIAEQNGLLPAHWRALVNTEGRPPGPEELVDMLRRGILTEAEVEQGIRESDVKNKYVKSLVARRERLPEQGTVTHMLSTGALDTAHAHQLLTRLGYTPQVADALIKAAHRTVVAHVRELSVAQVIDAVALHAMSAADAHTRLGKMGYTRADVDVMLELADLRRTQRERDAVVTKLRTLFVAHKIDEHEVRARLTEAGIAPDGWDHLIKVWTLEQTTTVRHLTEAQVVAALKRDLIDLADATARLDRMGYPPADIAILLAPPKPPVKSAAQ